MRSTFLLVLVVLGFSSTVDARDGQSPPDAQPPLKNQYQCQPKDNRNAVLGPVQDQHHSGLCYAFAGSDLLSYALKQRLSPIDVAFSYIEKQNWIEGTFYSIFSGERKHHGGLLGAALRRAISQGVCPESDMPVNSATLLEAIALLELSGPKDEEIYTEALSCMNKMDSDPYWRLHDSLFSRLTYQALIKAYSQASGSNVDAIKTASDEDCENDRVFPKDLQVHTSPPETDKNKTYSEIQQIDAQLNNNNIVGITYDDNWLKVVKGPNNVFTQGYGNHVSSIVARRFSAGQCQYLVRGSWGADCRNYNQKYNCDKSDPGNVWVPEADLRQMISSVTYLTR